MTETQVKSPVLPPMLIRRVKTLQGLAGISEDDYRALLGGYGAASCKDLSITDARHVCEFLQKLVDAIPEKKQFRKAKPYSELRGRSADMATPKQLRMLEAMWMSVTWQKNRPAALEAYHTFLKNKFNLLTPEWIERDKVSNIKRTLDAMIAQAGKKKEISR